jgi:hypothetical protein
MGFEIQIQIPTKWEMFTSAGNRALTAKATTCANKVARLAREGRATEANVSQALTTYLVSWLRSGSCKSTREANDTAVRECVGDFHDRVWNLLFRQGGSQRWDAHLAAAYRRLAR